MASSQNFAFNGPLLEKYGIDVSNVKDYASLEPVLKAIKEKDPNVVPFAMNKSYGGPSDDFDYVAVDGLPFVVDLKGDTTKIVDRYTIPFVM